MYNDSTSDDVCGSLFDDPQRAAEQGDARLPPVFAALQGGVGVIGAVLNALVVIGVRGDAKLGTTVNKLLIWITCFAFLEAVYGTFIRSLVLGNEYVMKKGKPS